MKVSIIVPIYNVESYLPACIESLIHQSYSNIEVILVNDGSSDHCKDIVDEYASSDSRIIPIHKINSGPAEARRTGINSAQGDYIAFCDGDDYLPLDAIEQLVAASDNGNIDIVAGTVTYVYPNLVKKRIPLYMSGSVNDKWLYINHLIRMNIPWMLVAKIFKKELFNGVQMPTFKVGQDAIVMLQLATNAGSIYYIDSSLYCYNQRFSSATYNLSKPFLIDFYRYAQFIYSLFEDVPNDIVVDAVKFFKLRHFVLILHKGGANLFPITSELRALYKAYGSQLKAWERILFLSFDIHLYFGQVVNSLIIELRKIKLRLTKCIISYA